MLVKMTLKILYKDCALAGILLGLVGESLCTILLASLLPSVCSAVEPSQGHTAYTDARLYLDVLWIRKRDQLNGYTAGSVKQGSQNGDGESPIWSILSVSATTGDWNIVVDQGFSPRVSPDGHRIAYRQNEAAFACSIDNPQDESRLGDPNWGPICWSPDSKSVVLGVRQLTGNGEWRLRNLLVPVGDQAPSAIAIGSDLDIEDWSNSEPPWVAVTGNSSSQGHQLALVAKDCKEVKLITSDGVNVHPRFSPDGQSIAFVNQKGGIVSALIYDRRTGTIEDLYRPDSNMFVDAICWSPSGREIAMLMVAARGQLKGQQQEEISLSKRERRIVVLDRTTKATRTVSLGDADINIIDIGSVDWR